MSTSRRALGTGPTTTTRATLSPRLLPVERASLLDVDDDQALVDEQSEPDQKRRRKLGPGAPAE
ncbi:hypothetical protein [Streptomyces sp. NPDC058542]|uniref:hypothetical protein n=1 Tax=Streptomyces sp. NPDC058542 TaxID=3346543 RepID=UPI003651C8FB